MFMCHGRIISHFSWREGGRESLGKNLVNILKMHWQLGKQMNLIASLKRGKVFLNSQNQIINFRWSCWWRSRIKMFRPFFFRSNSKRYFIFIRNWKCIYRLIVKSKKTNWMESIGRRKKKHSTLLINEPSATGARITMEKSHNGKFTSLLVVICWHYKLCGVESFVQPSTLWLLKSTAQAAIIIITLNVGSCNERNLHLTFF